MDSNAVAIVHCNFKSIVNSASSRRDFGLQANFYFWGDSLNVCSDSLSCGRERRMSQRFCTSRRSFCLLFSRFRCTSLMKWPIFKMPTTSQCFRCFFSVTLLSFPISKMRLLDLLSFERVSSLLSASLFFCLPPALFLSSFFVFVFLFYFGLWLVSSDFCLL